MIKEMAEKPVGTIFSILHNGNDKFAYKCDGMSVEDAPMALAIMLDFFYGVATNTVGLTQAEAFEQIDDIVSRAKEKVSAPKE